MSMISTGSNGSLASQVALAALGVLAIASASWLEDLKVDHRVDRTLVSHLRYSVFGVGDSAYGPDRFCKFARQVSFSLHSLGGRRLAGSMWGDISDARFNTDLEKWGADVYMGLKSLILNGDIMKECEDEKLDDAANNGGEGGEGVLDVEDLGRVAGGLQAAKNAVAAAQSVGAEGEVVVVNRSGRKTAGNAGKKVVDVSQMTREMLTPNLRKNLEKQGYKLIGSHSGVKMCRWTKAQLRGHGGCYKHSFYGIESHRGVFCWRHQTNPVGTEWRWKADPPMEIVLGALERHRNMIKQMKGVPGVTPEKFNEGMDVAHCALRLHEKKISSFLVTNAQFPEIMETLNPVTRLYVSIDAGNKDSLKRVDRPLFRDYWERFLLCLDALKKKRQRTVYRLTLVKGFNAEDEMAEYADLVRRGLPDFIEVKAHSCSLLIAHKSYKLNGKWHTWIDYPKFHELAHLHKTQGIPFTSMDYLAPTPEWAVYGNEEKGFDPGMKRVYRKKAKYEGLSHPSEAIQKAAERRGVAGVGGLVGAAE
ncbi:hypothetical protein HDV05_005382 [Chytridiales sp. JEL 0842]|nr:hypothetical protein HDV05_005382 [Chytridiales sp. JEL 0842]